MVSPVEGTMPECPISRVLSDFSVATISLGRPLPDASSNLPGSRARRAASPPLFGLSPSGVYRAGGVTASAGALLPHRFTLTARFHAWRFVFCGTVPGIAPAGGYPALCPVELGLSSGRVTAARGRLWHSGQPFLPVTLVLRLGALRVRFNPPRRGPRWPARPRGRSALAGHA